MTSNNLETRATKAATGDTDILESVPGTFAQWVLDLVSFLAQNHWNLRVDLYCKIKNQADRTHKGDFILPNVDLCQSFQPPKKLHS